MSKCKPLLALVLVLNICVAALSQTDPAITVNKVIVADSLTPYKIEIEKLSIEKRKLDMEFKKLGIEESKAFQQWSTSVLTFLTIITSAIVAFVTFRGNLKNVETSRRNAEEAAKIQSKLKAMDVVIAANSNTNATQRIKLVNHIFGEEVIKEGEFKVEGIGPGHDHNRKELIKMIIDNLDKKREVIDLWKISFGTSGFGEDILNIEKHFFEDKQAN